MSTVILPNDKAGAFGQNTDMLKDILTRIEKRMEAMGLNDYSTAIKAGLSGDAVRNIRRAVRSGDANRGMSTTTLLALAPALGTTASWLIEEREPEEKITADLQDALVRASTAPKGVQESILDYVNYQLANHQTRDTAA